MQFKEVIGQNALKQQLVEMAQHNRLSHALLFLGKEGSGALPMAIAFAQYICLPQTPSNRGGLANAQPAPPLFGDEPPLTSISKEEQFKTVEAIDEWMKQQPAFSKAEGMVHPDIHFSYPVISKKSGDKPVSANFISDWREFIKTNPYGNVYDWLQFIDAENKQGNITAEECNDIIHKLSLKSFESEYKILIMWMPEYLGNSGNKLLKLIEEPPPNTLFILVAENESLILPTILSRCQLVKIPALESADIEKALIERNNIAPGQARQVAGLCEGNYREALQLAQHAEEDWQSLLQEWISTIYRTKLPDQVKWIDEMSRLGREKQKQLLRYFNHLLELAIRLRVLGAADTEISPREKDFAERLNKISDIEQQQAIIEELDRAGYYIERNANAKILFHAITIKLYHIIHNKIVLSIN